MSRFTVNNGYFHRALKHDMSQATEADVLNNVIRLQETEKYEPKITLHN